MKDKTAFTNRAFLTLPGRNVRHRTFDNDTTCCALLAWPTLHTNERKLRMHKEREGGKGPQVAFTSSRHAADMMETAVKAKKVVADADP